MAAQQDAELEERRKEIVSIAAKAEGLEASAAAAVAERQALEKEKEQLLDGAAGHRARGARLTRNLPHGRAHVALPSPNAEIKALEADAEEHCTNTDRGVKLYKEQLGWRLRTRESEYLAPGGVAMMVVMRHPRLTCLRPTPPTCRRCLGHGLHQGGPARPEARFYL